MDYKNPIVIDFETYYDKEYSLSKLTTEEYIRDPRFECIGLSIKDSDKPTEFFRGESWIPTLTKLITDNPERPVVAHNAVFDGGILGLKYDIHPKHYLDTVSMARVSYLDQRAGRASLDYLSKALIELGYSMPNKGTTVQDMLGVHMSDMSEEQWVAYAEYCITDVDICFSIYHVLRPTIPDCELKMMDITTRMYTDPLFEFDQKVLGDYKERLENARVDNLEFFKNHFGFASIDETEKAIRSRKKFPELLETLGVPCPMKWSEKQQKEVPALAKTDEALTALLEHPNHLVAELVDTKLNANKSLAMSRCQTFIELGLRGSVPVPLKYYGAHTGRYGGMDKLNFQNLPKRSGDTSLRRSMVAPDGYIVVGTDSSQIEARLLAYAAQETGLINIFMNGECPYSDMAAAIYGVSYDEIYRDAKIEPTDEGVTRRNVGKTTVLGAGYQMGADAFSEQLRQAGLEEVMDMAGMIVKTYRAKNPNIQQLWYKCQDVLEVLIAGQTMSFGGENDDLFYADGSTEFWGEVIPSIKLPNGTYVIYRNLRKEADPESFTGYSYKYDQFRHGKFIPNYIYGGKVTENLVQALAFAVLKHQAILIDTAGVPVNLNVHDEWVSVVPKSQAKEAIRVHAHAMRSVPDYIPQGLLDCEVDIGANYMDTQTLAGV